MIISLDRLTGGELNWLGGLTEKIRILNMHEDTCMWNFYNCGTFTILQYQRIPEGICIRLEIYFFHNWQQQKTHLAQSKTSKNKKLGFFSFFKKTKMPPINRNCAENHGESSMLSKLLISCKKQRT